MLKYKETNKISHNKKSCGGKLVLDPGRQHLKLATNQDRTASPRFGPPHIGSDRLACVAAARLPGPARTQHSFLGRLCHAMNILSALQIIVGAGDSMASEKAINYHVMYGV